MNGQVSDVTYCVCMSVYVPALPHLLATLVQVACQVGVESSLICTQRDQVHVGYFFACTCTVDVWYTS